MADSPPQPQVGVALRQGLGNQDGINVLQLAGVKIFLRLCFLDPEGVKRFFPPELPVRVEFGGGGTARAPVCTLGSGGRLTCLAKGGDAEAWREFTLRFPAQAASPPSPRQPYHVVFEARGASPSPPGSPPSVPRTATERPTTQERFFSLPVDFPAGAWGLRHSDWTAGTGANAFPASATFTANTGIIRHNQDPPLDIGTVDNPVELILDPHWKFFRFEFFDRYWGPVPVNPSPPRASHGARISIPPVVLEGFRGHPGAADADPVETASNWTIDDGANRLLQCLPWILRREHGGAALAPLTGSNLSLRFKTAANSYVFSQSDTAREIRTVAPGDAALNPGPDRLRYYDLPPVWKSRRYYTRNLGASPPADGKFFQSLTQADVDRSNARGTPLVFCLDDIVLFRDNGGRLEPLNVWNTASDRVAIFNHRFNDTVGAAPTHHGVYKHQASAGAVNQFNLPQSNVVITRTPGNKDTYLFDYPDWTRLVITQGNLFDVFDRRAPDDADAGRVVGARAAVRWVDATITFPGITTQEWGWVVPPPPPPGTAGWIAAAAPHNPVPGRKLAAAVRTGGRPTYVEQPAANPLFAYQPFHYQNCTEFPRRYDVNRTTWFGRFDMLLLRCCDVTAEGGELATNMHYIRSVWDGSGNNAAGKNFNDSVSINTSARWNGADALNNCRALLLPTQSPPGNLVVQVVWFDQAVQESRAHFKLTVGGGGGRSNRGSGDGTGEYNNPGDMQSNANGWHTSAHESGHMNGLPDDYNERWDGASYDQMSYRANGPPGDPYEPDGRLDATTPMGGGLLVGSMMNVNSRIRGRYFWPSAEWVSRVLGVPLKVKYQDPQDTVPYEYLLPQHPRRGEDRTYLSWPYLGLRNATRNAASPVAPVVANWDKFEYYLYALGKDHYSQHVLAGLCASAKGWRPGLSPPASPPPSPPGGIRFDGLLVIDVRLECTLPGNATVATEDTARERLAARIAAAVRKSMCYRWRFNGRFGAPAQQFDNCLIHFSPLLLVANDPHGHYGAKGWNVAALRTEYGSHFNLAVNCPAGATSVAWNTGTRTLTLNCVSTAAVESRLEDAFPKFFGFNKTMASVNAADIALIVNLLGGSGVAVTEVP